MRKSKKVISAMLDKVSEGKIQWHKGSWFSGPPEKPTQLCVMGFLGIILDTEFLNRGISDMHSNFVVWLRQKLTEQEIRELVVLARVIEEQYPDFTDYECSTSFFNEVRPNYDDVGDLLDYCISWNDSDQGCKTEEELVRVLEKTAIRLAEGP